MVFYFKMFVYPGDLKAKKLLINWASARMYTVGTQLQCPTSAGKITVATFSERLSARSHDHRRIQDMVEHLLPAFKQYYSKRTTKLIEVLFSGGKFCVSDRLIQPIGEF